MELFDIIDENGIKTGVKKTRYSVHRDGDLHGSVHIWIIQKNQVLLQKRNKDKDSFPLCFDAACTGHIDSGEDSVTAAVRELKEELSLRVKSNELRFLFRQKLCINNGEFISNELNDVYILDKHIENSELLFQDEEIDELVWIDINELEIKLKSNNPNYCIKYEEYKKVLEMI